MALLNSTALRNAMLNGLKDALADGFIHVYASSLANIPASSDEAINPANHTLLLTVYGDGVSAGLNLGTASGGSIGKDPSENWSGTVLADGTAAFFRHVGSADTGAASTTQPRLQGRVGTAGAELNISSLALTAGDTRTVNYANIVLPA